jgi:hypothetical protein
MIRMSRGICEFDELGNASFRTDTAFMGVGSLHII